MQNVVEYHLAGESFPYLQSMVNALVLNVNPATSRGIFQL